jgi:hypothetical protein
VKRIALFALLLTGGAALALQDDSPGRPARGAPSKQDAKKAVEEISRIVARMQKTLGDKSLPDEEKIAQVAHLSANLPGSAAGVVVVRIEGGGVEELSPASKSLLDRFRSLDSSEMDRLIGEMVRYRQEAARRDGDKGLERQQDDVRKLIDRMLRDLEPQPERK